MVSSGRWFFFFPLNNYSSMFSRLILEMNLFARYDQSGNQIMGTWNATTWITRQELFLCPGTASPRQVTMSKASYLCRDLLPITIEWKMFCSVCKTLALRTQMGKKVRTWWKWMTVLGSTTGMAGNERLASSHFQTGELFPHPWRCTRPGWMASWAAELVEGSLPTGRLWCPFQPKLFCDFVIFHTFSGHSWSALRGCQLSLITSVRNTVPAFQRFPCTKKSS